MMRHKRNKNIPLHFMIKRETKSGQLSLLRNKSKHLRSLLLNKSYIEKQKKTIEATDLSLHFKNLQQNKRLKNESVTRLQMLEEARIKCKVGRNVDQEKVKSSGSIKSKVPADAKFRRNDGKLHHNIEPNEKNFKKPAIHQKSQAKNSCQNIDSIEDYFKNYPRPDYVKKNRFFPHFQSLFNAQFQLLGERCGV